MKTRLTLIPIVAIFLVLQSFCFAACDELSQDDGAVSEVLPGTWSFEYEADDELDFIVNYDLIIFRADGTCSITYEGGQIDGTYRTGEALIRIESEELPDDALLWQLVSFSPYIVVAEYDYVTGGRHIKVRVTLTKVD